MESQTPQHLRPTSLRGLGLQKLPSFVLKTSFFRDTRPSRWLLEEFLTHMYGDVDSFVADLQVLKGMRIALSTDVLVRNYFQRLWVFYTTEEGKVLAEQIKANIALKSESNLFIVNAATSKYQSIRGGVRVAASGILDLRVNRYGTLSSNVPEFAATSAILDEVLPGLRSDLRLGLRALVKRCNMTLGSISERELEGIPPPVYATFVEMTYRGLIPNSEMEIVSLWKRCLETLSDGKLHGELVCRATLEAKRLMHKEFHVEGDTEAERKVDLLLRVENLEVLNSEAKVNDDQFQGDIQYKKNLRINHCIYKEASRRGLELPACFFWTFETGFKLGP
ncbi:hypothetical protein BGZ65_004806 [Modicella reniformis]|uniref:Uncharacterized protein n=1 Tax=Modicella reniformis TaxID=1440133 RepID=A0A9P6MHG6_9FUNG|nr:hypothetical protein BGZ65_004806 [Modicella reniformis]